MVPSRDWRATYASQIQRATFASPQTLGTIPFSQTVRDAQAGVTNPGTAPSTVSHFVEVQPELSLTDLDLKPVYNHSNCPDMIAGLYEPLLQEAIRYDRTTYTFTAKGLIAAAGTAGAPDMIVRYQ